MASKVKEHPDAEEALSGIPGGVHIHGSTVMVGNSGDHVTMSGGASAGGENVQDEEELLRIYKKLNIRSKSEFMLHCFAFEDEYDGKMK